MTDERDPYRVLGVPPLATPEQIASAYRRLARRHHPDVSTGHGAEQRMAEINAAWTVLRDPVRRAAWDRAHAAVRTGTPWPSAPASRGSTAWRRGPDGEGAAGPPPGNPRGSVLPFGRHIGWSLGEVARVDPGYLVWLEARREGAPYRAEIEALLAAMRPAAEPAAEARRRRFG